MNVKTETADVKFTGGVPRFNIFASPVGPRIYLDAPNDNGNDGGNPDPNANTDPNPNPEGNPGGEGGEGKSKLSDREAELLKENMDKKRKLKEAQDALAAANERLKAFDGVDPNELRQLLAEREEARKEKEEAERKALEAKGDWERLKQMMAEEHEKVVGTLKGELDTTKNALSAAQAQIVDLTIGAQFSNSAFINDELVLTPSKARQIYGSHFELVDGRVVGYDKPAGAKDRTPLVDGAGNPLPFEAALKKLVDADPDRERLVRSKLKEGAGSKTTNDKVDPKTPEVYGVHRIAAALSKTKPSK